ncbi:ABC transporter ATP-binding protein [Halobacterium noricense]|uniref:ABC transporter ATP-binding protein n=1 Tax=Halobacterium noricense TaxID=223182 RepID=UPI001E50720C|nr:ABC transporter ATP-binding protein [Halobacterium noricense]UHH23957.1 ABC transporter ATP-binding protein [Halobacterium noricense]
MTETESQYDPDDGVLVVDDMTKQFGGLLAVDSLSFSIQEEEIVGFIGPNGAGKSTTFSCVTGRYTPTSGHIWYQGEDVTETPLYQMVDKGVTLTFQDFRPLPDRNVVQNVALALVPNRIVSMASLRNEAYEQAVDICNRVGLGDDVHRFPDELPHAGLLRLEIARGLATDPTLFLVDEPFAGLTRSEVDEIAALLSSLRDDGLTLVVIDHNMRGLLSLVDRTVVIDSGAKLASGPPEAIRSNPDVQEAYLGGDIA